MKKLNIKFDMKKALSIGSLILAGATMLVDSKLKVAENDELKKLMRKEIIDEMSKKKD